MNDFLTVADQWLNDPELFREAVERTARETGFASNLIEKDVFASLVLCALTQRLPEYVAFKGGTCLSKIYAGFYRLSEDLDFAVSVACDAPRAERRRLMEPIRQACHDLPHRCPAITIEEPLRGANLSSQYIMQMAYTSRVSGASSRIKVEIGLREPTRMPTEPRPAGTLLLNPITGAPVFPPYPVRVMALREVWAEKIRAAVTRIEPAIRDFYDLNHAVRRGLIDLAEDELSALVRDKLAVPGNVLMHMTDSRRSALERQVATELRPVLRERDFAQFSLESICSALAGLLGQPGRPPA